jgi:hypothetical protein
MLAWDLSFYSQRCHMPTIIATKKTVLLMLSISIPFCILISLCLISWGDGCWCNFDFLPFSLLSSLPLLTYSLYSGHSQIFSHSFSFNLSNTFVSFYFKSFSLLFFFSFQHYLLCNSVYHRMVNLSCMFWR